MTRPTQNDISQSAADFPDLSALLPVLLGDSDHAPDGCDTASYLAMLDSFDIDDMAKRKFIHILQALIETVIGIRFGVDPATLELKSRSSKLASSSSSVVGSSFNKSRDLDAGFAAASKSRTKGGEDERIQE